MNIQGTHTIGCSPAQVFAALTDPEVLQRVIPGCEKMEKASENEYNAHLKIGLASIKGSYVGKVRLRDQQPPHRFVLDMEGKGAPGFVKGSALVELKEESRGTKLSYTANVQVGGLIAAVGSRVIEAAAKKLAAEFFQKFAAAVTGVK